MNNTIKILLVDDHPMILRGYQLTLEQLQDDYNLEFDTAANCTDVLELLDESTEEFYDLILLDICLPPSKNKIAVNGEDLGFYIRKKFPKSKIIVQTGLTDSNGISNVFNTIRPEGFLIKSDIDEEVLTSSVSTVLSNRCYYSDSVNTLLSSTDFDDKYIDIWNRKILYHLSLGTKMKELPYHIPLSMPTIERRKRDLKSLFGISNGGNKELLNMARISGLI